MSQPSMYQESLRAFLKPVLKYLDDPSVSEIMINGPDEVWIEGKGKVLLTDAKFTPDGLEGAARNMAQFVGRILNDERPQLDARLPDGSRIHVVLPPIARKGTTISIRKFMQGRPGIEKLIEWGSMTPQMAYLIKAMVHTKLNIVVSGGTGSGKTTLLNIVSTLIPNDERILTIEDSAELQLQQEHIVPFESRPADKFGKGEVNMGHLLHSALRLRPDRIVVGEVRGGEAFDLMQAMNTGHGGSMATTHANTPTDTLRRLESLCLMAGVDMPMVAVRAQVASAINAVICCERFHDGSRRTTAIAEVLPLDEKGEYRTQNLFVYAPTHKDAAGHIHGYHAPTGALPTFLERMRAHGFADIEESFFDPATYGLPPPPNVFLDKFSPRYAPSLKHRERGEPDPKELKDQMARGREFSEMAEQRHKEKVKAGTFAEGYKFVEEIPEKTAQPEPAKAPAAAAPAPAAEPARRPTPPPGPAAATPRPPAPAPRALGDDDPETTQTKPPATTTAAAERAEAAARNETSEVTRPPVRPASQTPRPQLRPSIPQRRPDAEPPKVQVAAELGAETLDNEVTPPPTRSPLRPAAPAASPGASALPPGKRPLPVRSGPPRPRAPEPERDGGTEDYEAPREGEKTMIREMPDRFRR